MLLSILGIPETDARISFSASITGAPQTPKSWKIATHVSVSSKGKQTRHVRGKTQLAAVICCLHLHLREIK